MFENKTDQPACIIDSPPSLSINRIGFVSRDYNDFIDFSNFSGDIISLLDRLECDTVLFSLFSSLQSNISKFTSPLQDTKSVQNVLFEDFTKTCANGSYKRNAGNYHVLSKTSSGFFNYSIKQLFGRRNEMPNDFVDTFKRTRIMGNCCLLLCGETNGVKYSPSESKVLDHDGLRHSIPDSVKIILNPIHDRMTRHEMPKKRLFLSEAERLVVSVWNKGKIDKRGRKDGSNPPWGVYYNGEEIKTEPIKHKLPLDMAILDASKFQ